MMLGRHARCEPGEKKTWMDEHSKKGQQHEKTRERQRTRARQNKRKREMERYPGGTL